MSVAIVGAGISGLVCAGKLEAAGMNVTVFEKSRGPSGRMATRRINDANSGQSAGLQFDHGAQYFTVRDPEFRRVVDEWINEGAVAPWNARIATIGSGETQWKVDQPSRYVGVPRMSAIGRRLAKDVSTIKFQSRVDMILRRDLRWDVLDEHGNTLGNYDAVVVSAPAPQTTLLLWDVPSLRRDVANVKMNGCWAAMLALNSPLEVEFDGAFVEDSILSWVACDSSKPGRPQSPQTWVLHGDATWSEETLDLEPTEVLPQLIQEFTNLLAVKRLEPSFATCHRWRYAIPEEPLEDRMLYDPALQIGVCGDWCGGPRVEGAYLSGSSLADRLIESV